MSLLKELRASAINHWVGLNYDSEGNRDVPIKVVKLEDVERLLSSEATKYVWIDRDRLKKFYDSMAKHCDDCLAKYGADTYCLHRNQFPKSKCGLGIMVTFLESLLGGKLLFSEDAGLQEAELSDELRQTLLKSKEDKKAGRVRKYEDVARECGLRGESSNTPKVCVNCPISGECNEKDVDEKTEDDEYDPEKVAEKILMRKKDVDEKDKTYCIWTTCKRFETDCPHRTYFCVREKMTKTQFQAKYPEYKFCEDYEEEGCTLQGTAVCYQNEYACSTCVINKGARLDASCNDEGPKKVVSSFPNSRPDEVQREEAESSSTKKETSV